MADSLESFLDSQLGGSAGAINALVADAGYRAALASAAERLAATLRAGGKVVVAGNGGSASDALHIAAELAGRFNFNRPGLPVIALGANTSGITAIGNDYGYNEVFAREIDGLGREGDLLIALSTSGRSANILAAAAKARDKGMAVIGLTGRSGGDLKALCDICLCAPADATPRIQECHLVSYHFLCGWAELALFGETHG